MRKTRNFTTKHKAPWMDIEKENVMLTIFLVCIFLTQFILCDFCFTFILWFPLWTILIISWFPPCSAWPLPSSFLICTGIWNSKIKRRRNEMSNYRVVGVVCLLISGDCFFHLPSVWQQLVGLCAYINIYINIWIHFIVIYSWDNITVYNLSHVKVPTRSVTSVGLLSDPM